MAVAIMLSRSTPRLAAAAVGRQYLCCSPVNLSRLIIPSSSISSVRRFSAASTQTTRTSCDESGLNSDKIYEAVVKDLTSQLKLMREEVEALRKASMANEEIKGKGDEKEKEVVVKEKDLIIREINAEISRICVEDTEEIFMDDFPFKIRKDKPGVAEVTLSRNYKDETITIKVKRPSIPDLPLAVNYGYLSESSHYEMPLIVRISTSWLLFRSKNIEFHCIAERDKIVIEKLQDPADETDKEGGVLFNTLDHDLRGKITEYLEARDITPETGEYLYGYMLNKMNKENKRGLQKFKELIEAAA